MTSASDAQRSAIDALQKFYSVIIGAAFTGAVLKLLENFSFTDWSTKQISQAALFVAFIFTIVPFYHGTERHLFEAHIRRNTEGWGEGGKPTPLLLDVAVFMALGAILFAMGRSTSDPGQFFSFWVALLIVDILWSIAVWRSNKGKWPRWAINNFAWLALAIALWFLLIPALTSIPCIVAASALCGGVFVKTAVVAFAEIGRTVIDYHLYGDFYFPPMEDHEADREIVYLAAPYTKIGQQIDDAVADTAMREARYNAVTDVAAQLIEQGEAVYSPITMTHPIDVAMHSKKTSEFWVELDRPHMELCSRIVVLMVDGWDKSAGVQKELEHFASRGIAPEFASPGDFGITKGQSRYAALFIS